MRVITYEPSPQPPLPDGVNWPQATRDWWATWASSPLAEDFTDLDWSYLIDTAALHAQMWMGDVKLAAEIRLRVAKFGVTPEDRARLKITFVAAEVAEERRSTVVSNARARYAHRVPVDPRQVLRDVSHEELGAS